VVGDDGTPGPAFLRALQAAADAAGSADVTYVTTPESLNAAVVDGRRHIEITQHLDLTTLASGNISTAAHLIKLLLGPSTWSIRVRPGVSDGEAFTCMRGTIAAEPAL
jgi:hypothetical protein